MFDRLSFPVGRVYEDVAVLYKVFYSSQKVVLSCVSKYHYMIHKNESITRGGYDPVKEYHYFLSLYEQDKFIQNAELGDITPWQLGLSMSIKRYFMCKHFGFYRMLYRGYRAIFKRKHKLLID